MVIIIITIVIFYYCNCCCSSYDWYCHIVTIIILKTMHAHSQFIDALVTPPLLGGHVLALQ